MRRGVIDTFRRLLLRHEPFLKVVGMVATIAIAIFAYRIDAEVSERSVQEKRVERAIQLSLSIMRDEKFRHVLEFAHETERHYESVEGARPSVTLPRLNGNLFDGEDRFAFYTLMRHSRRLAECIDADHYVLSGKENPEALCEARTVIMMLGDPLAELYFLVRPIMLCDDAFARSSQHLRKLIKAYELHHVGQVDFEDTAIEELTQLTKACGIYTKSLAEARQRRDEQRDGDGARGDVPAGAVGVSAGKG